MADGEDDKPILPTPQIEVTEEMAAVGAEALRRWYGEPGEPSHYLERAAEDVYLAMQKIVEGYRV